MSTGLRWSSEDYEKAQARAKFPVHETKRQDPLKHALSVLAALPVIRRETVTITLPWPPTVNHMHINVIKGRIRSKGYIAFCGLVAHIVEREKIASMGSKRLSVAICLHGPNKRSFDIDNRVKPILDALQRAGVFDDDEQVDSLAVTRGAIVKGGLCVVRIEAM